MLGSVTSTRERGMERGGGGASDLTITSRLRGVEQSRVVHGSITRARGAALPQLTNPN